MFETAEWSALKREIFWINNTFLQLACSCSRLRDDKTQCENTSSRDVEASWEGQFCAERNFRFGDDFHWVQLHSSEVKNENDTNKNQKKKQEIFLFKGHEKEHPELCSGRLDEDERMKHFGHPSLSDGHRQAPKTITIIRQDTSRPGRMTIENTTRSRTTRLFTSRRNPFKCDIFLFRLRVLSFELRRG